MNYFRQYQLGIHNVENKAISIMSIISMHEQLDVSSSAVKSGSESCRQAEEIMDEVRPQRCRFEARYNNLQEKEKFLRWRCPEKADKRSSFCVFHDRTKIQWTEEDYQKFKKRVYDRIDDQERGLIKPLECIGYHFPMNINFRHLIGLHTYNFPIYFSEAEFDGQVDLSGCTFNNTFSLGGATFRRDVLIRYTHFNDVFYPRHTKFYGSVNFRGTTFVNADFHDTIFNDKVDFRDSTFNGTENKEKGEKGTRFLDVKFNDKANFENTIICGETLFQGVNFLQAKFSTNAEFNEKITKFRYVTFEKGENSSFDTRNLTNVSFKNTDITRVKFNESVVWCEKPQQGKKVDRYKVWDERRLEDTLKKLSKCENVKVDFENQALRKSMKEKGVKCTSKLDFVDIDDWTKKIVEIETYKIRGEIIKHKTDKVRGYIKRRRRENDKCTIVVSDSYIKEGTLESVKAIYRNLRENCEYWLRYDEASQFFIREMELKRNYREHNVFWIKETDRLRKNLSLTGLYYYLSKYGESLKRPTIMAIIIVFVSTMYWLTQSDSLSKLSLSIEGLAPLGESFERSILAFFQLRSEAWQDYLVRILGGLSLGLMAITLRRKFERKLRH
jgi:uncharacterized protein YjbI with pentapeptide repeats